MVFKSVLFAVCRHIHCRTVAAATVTIATALSSWKCQMAKLYQNQYWHMVIHYLHQGNIATWMFVKKGRYQNLLKSQWCTEGSRSLRGSRTYHQNSITYSSAKPPKSLRQKDRGHTVQRDKHYLHVVVCCFSDWRTFSRLFTSIQLASTSLMQSTDQISNRFEGGYEWRGTAVTFWCSH